jgi:hypothetical protein
MRTIDEAIQIWNHRALTARVQRSRLVDMDDMIRTANLLGQAMSIVQAVASGDWTRDAIATQVLKDSATRIAAEYQTWQDERLGVSEPDALDVSSDDYPSAGWVPTWRDCCWPRRIRESG